MSNLESLLYFWNPRRSWIVNSWWSGGRHQWLRCQRHWWRCARAQSKWNQSKVEPVWELLGIGRPAMLTSASSPNNKMQKEKTAEEIVNAMVLRCGEARPSWYWWGRNQSCHNITPCLLHVSLSIQSNDYAYLTTSAIHISGYVLVNDDSTEILSRSDHGCVCWVIL